MRKVLCSTGILLSLIFSCNHEKKAVSITDKNGHYEITIDLAGGVSHRTMGMQYGRELIKAIPDFEEIANTIINMLVIGICHIDKNSGPEEVFDELLKKTDTLRSELQKDYYDELEGISSNFHYDATNDYTDKLLSRDEYYLMNFLTDIGGEFFDGFIGNKFSMQCCSISAFKEGSETGNPVIARIFDFPVTEMRKIHAITTIKNRNKSIVMIGFAGCTGIHSAINKHGIFTAIYYSHTGKECITERKGKSLIYDLRYALENYSTLSEVADYIKTNKSRYIINSLISLSDRNEAKVLECDLTGEEKTCELRSYDSKLHDGISWEHKDMIANVNSFLLYGNEDNHSTQPMNSTRWDSINTMLDKTDSTGKLSIDELIRIASYYRGNRPHSMSEGDIYNDMTGQIIIFQPVEPSLNVFFCPFDTDSPLIPDFENIDISILR